MVLMGGGGQMVLTFVYGVGRYRVGAMQSPNICNTENYDNSLYKGTSNWLMSHL